ncbi:class I adenylate-forming enzyme family protein [Streptomyces sp. 1331.2]|uniref:class I adenylate-forming enzyme family protein n=1 Tax=Streptomyces sp. 1331.2 TaxID=1938835 RepID=UPI001C53CD23|nr:class I adenylate-forming enzyme family protein [Streptomyces sp. 1331.2]
MTAVSLDLIDLPFGWDDVNAFLDRAVDLNRTGTGAGFADVTADVTGLGLAPGTPVVIALPNGRPLLEHWFAVLLTGGVPLTVSPATSSARIAELSARTGAGAVIALRPDPARYGAADSLPVGDARAVLLPTDGPRHPAGSVLMLTSGTSGLFSACLHRADSLVRNARRHAEAVGLRPDDTVFVNLPLFYSYAIVAQALAALLVGARLVISGPPFSPATYPGLLDEHGITSSSVTPTIARLLLRRGEKLPSGLRMLTVGGDQLPAEQVAGLLRAVPDTELYVTYGLTEAGPRVATLAAHREPEHRFGSVGLPLPGVGVELRDVRDGVGELLVRTDTALVAKLGGNGDRALATPGLVATGDRFRIDEDGYLYFDGRLSDFLVVKGEKVSLSAVRRLALAQPGVVGCTTRVGTEPDGSPHYELDIRLDEDAAGQAERIRRSVLSFLLPGERPRTVSIGAADPAALQK